MDDLLAGPADVAAGLAVHGADAVDRSARVALVAHDVPARLAAKDPTLWGPGAEAAARTRLGWLDTHCRSRELLPQLAELTAELGDLDHVVLAGPGGVTLAAEVIADCLGRPLTVLDTADPGPVRAALADRPTRTVLVLAGRDLDRTTDAHLRAFRQSWHDAGPEAARHVVVVTPPGSALEALADELGAVVIPTDPEADGHWSALTATGLVPAALAGAPVTELLDEAAALAGALDRVRDNPGLALGAAVGAAADDGRATVALVPDGTGLDGLRHWAGALLAAATGGRVLTVPAESPDAPGAVGPDVLTVGLGGALVAGVGPGVAADLAVNGPLGAQFLTWEYAAAIAAVTLRVDPFAEPAGTPGDDEAAPAGGPSSVDGAIEVYAPTGAPTDLAGALRWLTDGLDADEHLAVTAYLDRRVDATVAGLRPLLARAAGRPVTFGWGPRHPHHSDGRARHLQITGAVTDDLDVPGRPYTFAELQAAQAADDRRALAGRERPVLRLHLTERAAGVAQLLDTAGRTRT
ncbi:glucose-6-phosphate isomerase [Micromonospora sp. NPDC018662]|uniref:glucose-6-phosphate isomerase n=1 Tax=Micromonospora sp. NPDC018662 TaxID=3364238 RepID=UPI0037B3F47D